MPRPSGFSRAVGSVRRLSSRAAQAVGRPSPSIWTNRGTQQSNTSKASVRRLIRRDPAKGKSLPLADRITDTHIDTGGPATSISARDRATSPGTGKRFVSSRGTNKSINKR